MTNTYKTNPEWFEAKLNIANEGELEDLYYRYELLLDPRDFTIFFFGAKAKLNAQEYKFLKAILAKNGDRINANKLMKEIKSKCQPDKMQELSYRIKNKIKKKLKVISPYRLPISVETDWILVDRNWEQNRDKYSGAQYQSFDFNKYFDMLIHVKDGYYYTDFVSVKKMLQSVKKK